MASAELAEMIYRLSQKAHQISRRQAYWELTIGVEKYCSITDEWSTLLESVGTLCLLKPTPRELVIVYTKERTGGKFPFAGEESGHPSAAWVLPANKPITADVLSNHPIATLLFREAVNAVTTHWNKRASISLQRFVSSATGGDVHIRDPKWGDIERCTSNKEGSKAEAEFFALLASYFALVAQSTEIQIVE